MHNAVHCTYKISSDNKAMEKDDTIFASVVFAMKTNTNRNGILSNRILNQYKKICILNKLRKLPIINPFLKLKQENQNQQAWQSSRCIENPLVFKERPTLSSHLKYWQFPLRHLSMHYPTLTRSPM